MKKGKSGQTSKQKSLPKVKAEQSKNIMDSLIVQLDNQDAEELEDVNAAAAHVLAEMNKPLAFNQEEHMFNKYNVSLKNENASKSSDDNLSPNKS